MHDGASVWYWVISNVKFVSSQIDSGFLRNLCIRSDDIEHSISKCFRGPFSSVIAIEVDGESLSYFE